MPFVYPHTHFHEPPHDVHALYKDVSCLKDWLFWLSKRLMECRKAAIENDIDIVNEIDTLATKLQACIDAIGSGLSTLSEADSTLVASIYNSLNSLFTKTGSQGDSITNILTRLEVVEKDTGSQGDSITNILTRLEVAEKDIEALKALIAGQVIGRRLTYNTDYTYKTYNGWVFALNDGVEQNDGYPIIYLYTGTDTTILTIMLSRTDGEPHRISHPSTLTTNMVYLRHSYSFYSTEGQGSRMFCVTFAGDYAYLNTKTEFTYTPTSIWLLNGRPVTQRAAWEAQPWVYNGAQSDALDTGITIGLASFADGYNNQFDQYNTSVLFFRGSGNNITMQW